MVIMQTPNGSATYRLRATTTGLRLVSRCASLDGSPLAPRRCLRRTQGSCWGPSTSGSLAPARSADRMHRSNAAR
jgi:hypothetical protein